MKRTKRICKWGLLVAVALISLGALTAAAKQITSVSTYATDQEVRVEVAADAAPAYQQHLDPVEWKFLVNFPGFSVDLSPGMREGNFPPEVADWVKAYRLDETPLGAQLVLLLGHRATPVDISLTRQDNGVIVVIPTGGTQDEEGSYILVPLGLVDPPLRFWEVSASGAAYRVFALKGQVSAEEEAKLVQAATKLETPLPQKRTVMSGLESFLFPAGIEKKPAKHSFVTPAPATPSDESPAEAAPEPTAAQATPEPQKPTERSWKVHREPEEAPSRYSYEDFAPRREQSLPAAEVGEEITEEPALQPEREALPAKQTEPEAEAASQPAPEPATPPESTSETEPMEQEQAVPPESAAAEEIPAVKEVLTPEVLPELENKPVELVITTKGTEVEVREPEATQEQKVAAPPKPPTPPPPPPSTPPRKPRHMWVPERERPSDNVPPPTPPRSWDLHLPPLLPPVPGVGIEYTLLNREHIDYEAVDVPLSQAISLMVASTSFNVIVDDSVGDMKITLSFRDTPLGEALTSITAAKDIMYKLVNNNTIIVGKREDVGRRLGGYVSRTFHLNYADAENVKNVLLENGLIAQGNLATYYGEPETLPIKTGEQTLSEGQKGLTGASIKPMIKLESTARRNVLIVTETPERLDVIAQVISELDRQPKQVTLETNIVEVSNEGLVDLGFHLPETISTNISEEVPLDSTGSPITVNPIPLGLWFQTLYRDPYTIQLSLEAVIQDGKARILARPNVPAVDGEQAIFFAGRLVPYISRPATTTGGTYTPPEVEYQPIGVILSFKPRIDDQNNITIEVNPSVSTLLEFMDLGQGAQAPVSQIRQVMTTVRVHDGETFVIGGLLSEEDRERITKMPLLADIPLFGKLFRRRETTKNRTEIMVFVTPRVHD